MLKDDLECIKVSIREWIKKVSGNRLRVPGTGKEITRLPDFWITDMFI